MSKVTAYYHIVFCTKERRMTIPLSMKDDVYRFIWKQVTDLKCELIRIGGIQNHIHLFINLHPSVALATLMQNIKSRSSGWMKSDGRFPDFSGWAADYYACTLAPEGKRNLMEYIKTQEKHHLGVALNEELINMCRYSDIEYDARDMR